MNIENGIELQDTVISAINNTPTHEDVLGFGGYICVDNYYDLLNINLDVIKMGTVAFVSDEGSYYHYKDHLWQHYDFIGYSSDGVFDGKAFKDFTISGKKLIDGCVGPELLSSDAVDSRVIVQNTIISDSIAYDSLSAEHFDYNKITNESFARQSISGNQLDIYPLDGNKIKENTLYNVKIKDHSIPSSKFEREVFYGNPTWEDYVVLPKSDSGDISLTSLGVPNKRCLVNIRIDGGYKRTGEHSTIGIRFGNGDGEGFGTSYVTVRTHNKSVSPHGHGLCLAVTDNYGGLHYSLIYGGSGDIRSSGVKIRVLWYFELEN